jgi:hypothetical protein
MTSEVSDGGEYSSDPYPRVIHSKTYHGHVKLWVIPNAIYNVISNTKQFIKEHGSRLT